MGSLSGGCVEEDLLEKLTDGELASEHAQYFQYGVTDEESERFGLTGYIEPNQHGVIVAPDRPGLGFEIDWEWIEHHRVASLS